MLTYRRSIWCPGFYYKIFADHSHHDWNRLSGYVTLLVFLGIMVEIASLFYLLVVSRWFGLNICVGGNQPRNSPSVVVASIVFCWKMWREVWIEGCLEKNFYALGGLAAQEDMRKCVLVRDVAYGVGWVELSSHASSSGSRSVFWSAVLFIFCSVCLQHSCRYLFVCDSLRWLVLFLKFECCALFVWPSPKFGTN